MDATSTRQRVLAHLFIALVTVLAVVGSGGGPARAHSDDGAMTVTAVEQVGPDQVRLEVGIVYANDDDPAEDATVTATLTGPAGEVVGPIELPRTTGALYGAQVQVPVIGNWSVAVGSTTPVAEATAAVEVTGESIPTSSPGPSVTSAGTAEAAAASSDESDQSDGGAEWLWVVVGLAVVLVAASVVVVTRRRGA